MPRWDPRAEDRLRQAALELFLEHGYENVTVAEITERAGLTRRSFSRYFTDKRDVLFAGEDRLPAVFARSVRDAGSALSPFAALLAALVDVAGELGDQAPLAAQRRAVVQASPELQERGRTKFAAVTDAVTDALRDRGTPAPEATLLARAGVAIFRTAFERWTDEPDGAGLPARVRKAAAQLAASLGEADLARPGDPDWSWLRAATRAPEMTLEVYESLPEDLARGIEVVDGTVIVRRPPSDRHRAVRHALLEALRGAARTHDQGRGTRHRVRAGIDVLLSEVPFHFRTPDLTVFRCRGEDQAGRWRGKPRASDVLIAAEIVSPGSRSEDALVKRVRYARAGIEHYWIVRLAQDDGPVNSVELLRLISDGTYATGQVTFRKKDILAVDTLDPFEAAISWEQLDEEGAWPRGM